MEEKKKEILIITDVKSTNKINLLKKDVLKEVDKLKIENVVNKEYYEKYDYICIMNNKENIVFKNYLLIYKDDNIKLYINEIIFNIILRKNLKIIHNINLEESIELGIVIKNIIKYEFKSYEKIDKLFLRVAEELKITNGIINVETNETIKKVYKAIGNYYADNNLMKKIKYRIFREKINKKFFETVIYAINKDLEKEIKKTLTNCSV